MRQLSVRRAASRSGDVIRPQSRSMNFIPLLLALQITSRTTWNPFVFGQYAEKSLEARHIRRAWISLQDLPLHNIAGFIQVVPLISEQEREKGEKTKGSSTLHAGCGYRRGPLVQDQRPNVAVPPVNLRGAVMGSVAQSSSQTSKKQTKKKNAQLPAERIVQVHQNIWTLRTDES